MFITFEGMLNKFRRHSEDTINSAVLGKYNSYSFLKLVLALTLLLMTINYLDIKLFIGLYILIVIVYVIDINTKKSALGATKKGLIYIKFKRFSYKEKEITNIPFDKLVYMDYKKILNINRLKIRYFDKNNKITELKFRFSSFILKFGFADQKVNASKMYRVLMAKQKELDKGDF